jgi:hypothetical protein
MLKPTTVEFSEKLRPKRITVQELRELLEAATSECRSVSISAGWPRGQRAQLNDASEINEIYNPHQLESLRVFTHYDDGSHLSLDLMSSSQDVSANEGDVD